VLETRRRRRLGREEGKQRKRAEAGLADGILDLPLPGRKPRKGKKPKKDPLDNLTFEELEALLLKARGKTGESS
jgi:hypothetical protein